VAVGDGATGVGVTIAAMGVAVLVAATGVAVTSASLMAVGVATGVDTDRLSRLTVIQLAAIQTMTNRLIKWQNLRVRIQPP